MNEENGGDGGGGGATTPEVTPVEPVTTPVTEVTTETVTEETSKVKEALPEKSEDNSKLGQVSSLVEKAGLDMKKLAEYAKANDGKVDLETMVALKDKHGDAVAELIANQIKDIHTERSKAATDRDNAIYDQVKDAFKDITSDPEQSGESMWQELATWSKEHVSNEDRIEINKLLSQGGLAAKLAVQELTTAFKEHIGKQEFQDAELISGESVAQTSDGGISKHEYNTELNKLTQAGHQYGESREIAALDARRMKSINRGIK
jgi:hypothetical protein